MPTTESRSVSNRTSRTMFPLRLRERDMGRLRELSVRQDTPTAVLVRRAVREMLERELGPDNET